MKLVDDYIKNKKDIIKNIDILRSEIKKEIERNKERSIFSKMKTWLLSGNKKKHDYFDDFIEKILNDENIIFFNLDANEYLKNLIKLTKDKIAKNKKIENTVVENELKIIEVLEYSETLSKTDHFYFYDLFRNAIKLKYKDLKEDEMTEMRLSIELKKEFITE